jgi:hypothetical protein
MVNSRVTTARPVTDRKSAKSKPQIASAVRHTSASRVRCVQCGIRLFCEVAFGGRPEVQQRPWAHMLKPHAATRLYALCLPLLCVPCSRTAALDFDMYEAKSQLEEFASSRSPHPNYTRAH